ncbi:hypothetical protein GOP47_0002671 [Adiantum capillus-veneris]|uniref:PsbP C-terminal domain-containing protein n=1 Tax=Adiantum capillus-veneris TaxID=13818 RepID=A0A9D4ZPC2_ADICA|nr:hypothetical protein GOP47_0002671 [Adiantum capillus-veneris]
MAMTVQRACANWSSSISDSKVLLTKPSQCATCSSLGVRASLPQTGSLECGRRQIVLAAGSFAASLVSLSNLPALAKAPSGYQFVLDKFDKYQFLYPFGWQEVSVKGQDCVYKDVIEPLESVSVNIIETNKGDMHELGSAEEVAKTLVGKVLTSPSQKAQLVEAKERVTEGRPYYTFEFVSKAPNYTRHAVSTVTIADGKFYTLTTGANERRWGKMRDKLRTVADSFAILQ